MNDNEVLKSLNLFESAIFQTPDVIDLSGNSLRLCELLLKDRMMTKIMTHSILCKLVLRFITLFSHLH